MATRQTKFLENLNGSPNYRYNVKFGPYSLVKTTSIIDLYDKYHKILWEDGRHKSNVHAFILEVSSIIKMSVFRISHKKPLISFRALFVSEGTVTPQLIEKCLPSVSS